MIKLLQTDLEDADTKEAKLLKEKEEELLTRLARSLESKDRVQMDTMDDIIFGEQYKKGDLEY